MSTPTPRTDDIAGCLIDSEEVVPADFARALETELNAATAERDQLRVDLELADVMYQRECEVEHELRTEVERLRSDRDCEKRLRKDADEFRENAIARAERAEADAAAYLKRAESFRKIGDEAETELVKERARLDSGQILLTVAGERAWHSGVDLRAAIDAAMKEGAK